LSDIGDLFENDRHTIRHCEERKRQWHLRHVRAKAQARVRAGCPGHDDRKPHPKSLCDCATFTPRNRIV
jgi:hypothetical protein